MNFFGFMKIFFLLALLTALTGCKTSYDVTLSNGKKVSGVSKPVLDKATGNYRFKLPDGREVKVSSSRIRLIEPHGESSEPQFVVPTQKKK
jgi:hypothetical protein